jgi:hypothetical protein
LANILVFLVTWLDKRNYDLEMLNSAQMKG